MKWRQLRPATRPCARAWLNDGQKAAVKHVLGSRDAVTLIRGPAGTGKTTLEQELGEALAAAGRPVVALAPTTGAVDVLRQEAGFATADTPLTVAWACLPLPCLPLPEPVPLLPVPAGVATLTTW